ncbi:MAG: ABC transporter ATP-binding protein [Candidatus Latescibacteria bacterium 4484_181]|nr:MAG: ABC transporter ATP-binding protein [Candidatus Latescibacteria bacterium 4484_181]RKY72284.1 MAG: lipoprotein-releasing system ATP-binding protein LolD [Candidatus Latescibacterota bacterium]HDN67749.1 ABC transporter ATP-binding protein [Bacillota bacterium]
MNENVLEAHGIYKSYPTADGQIDVLLGIDLEIKRGEIVAVVGPSGVGKSTLLHILGILDRPTRGQLWMDSTDVFSLSDDQLAKLRNRTVGFVFQFHYLLPELSALENVMVPGMIAGRRAEELIKPARELLSRVGLAERESHRPNQLSAGEQQRVAVVRALINNPELVLADEPSGNLDFASSRTLHTLLWELSRSLEKTFVIATHNLELASKADRVLQLSNGKIVSQG